MSVNTSFFFCSSATDPRTVQTAQDSKYHALPEKRRDVVRCPFSQGGPPNHAHTHTPPPRLSQATRSPLFGLSRVQGSLDISEGPGLGAPPGRLGITRPHGLSVSHTDSCSFALHARSGELTRFTTPGFPDSPYPARARCQWTLRGDADFVLSLTFHSFDVASCDDRGSDVVMVYDTLSPVEPRAVVQ